MPARLPGFDCVAGWACQQHTEPEHDQYDHRQTGYGPATRPFQAQLFSSEHVIFVGHCQRSEIGGRRSAADVRAQTSKIRNERGSLIIFPSIFPILLQRGTRSACSSWVIYLQCRAKSSEESVS